MVPAYFDQVSDLVLRSGKTAHRSFLVSTDSTSNGWSVLNGAHSLELNDKPQAFGKGSFFDSFELVFLQTDFHAPDFSRNEPAFANADVARSVAWVDSVEVPVATAPEPSTYLLMFGSMSIMSSTARRRRNDAVGWMASRRREDVAV